MHTYWWINRSFWIYYGCQVLSAKWNSSWTELYLQYVNVKKKKNVRKQERIIKDFKLEWEPIASYKGCYQLGPQKKKIQYEEENLWTETSELILENKSYVYLFLKITI